ncbi:MAG: 50S ribosomal protein L29 [Calditrichaceae bacterium]|nr:50S ribosomal protein L29 [Calditrichaceae bacterium]MBN2709093.1 50S ribosomal protein L29 [Calditrichaceae bacterium]RQV97050.1 MAG: 50S ribosomal protein L29 [Calditrichota bacterium]
MKSKEDLSGLSVDDLKQKLADTKEEYNNLNIQKATHQLNNPIRIRHVRREIARINTVIRQHELGIFKSKTQDK